MNLSNETWDVIKSYFRDTPNYLVKHHIDSYNEFIHNKIPLIMKNECAETIVRADRDNPDMIYNIHVYYGGKDGSKFRIAKPTIIDYTTGEMHIMYPNEARLKNLTYGFDFFYDVDIEYSLINGDNIIIDHQPMPESDFAKGLYLGNIPIMLKSDVCMLKGLKMILLRQ